MADLQSDSTSPYIKNTVWDDDLMSWVPQTSAGGGVGTEVQVTNFPVTQAVTGAFWQATQPVSAAALPLPAGAATSAEQVTQTASLSVIDDWDESDRAKVNIIAGQVGVQGGSGGITALTQRTIDVRAVTSAQSTVSVLTTNTTILAANAARLGATIFNESGAVCYVKLGTTASVTSYNVQIAIGGYYEVPYGYTGNIDGITVAITAVTRVGEFT